MKTQSFRFTFFLLICFALSLTATAQVISIPEPAPPPPDVRTYFKLDPYYEQWVDVKGFPVLASAKVNPYALKEAAWLINKMIGHRPDILQAMTKNKARLSVIAHTEIITEIPEYRNDPSPDFLIYRERGWGGSEGATVTSAEENILHYPGVRDWDKGSTLIHEFAHGIHFLGLNAIDPTFDERLNRAYETAMEQGLWQGTYASSDRREYWAESTHAWFYPDHSYSFNHIGNTRQDLKTYDPGVANLLTEVYGDHPWRYTLTTTRTHLPHLQGFNPQDSPTFVGFPELEEIYQQLRIPHSDGNGAWVNLPLHDPAHLPNLIKSSVLDTAAVTVIAFVNLSGNDILLYGSHHDGTEEYWTRVPPGFVRVTPSRVNELWIIKNIHGKNLAVFQAGKKTGRALIPTDITSSLPPVPLKDASIPDANLRAAIEAVLGRDGIIGHLTHLSAEKANIADLTGLEHAIYLRELHLWKNAVSDLSPLTRLTDLVGLYLGSNLISDISPLTELTNLESLFLDDNDISDVSPLAGLTKMRRLALNGNAIDDISPLRNLTNLRWMRLAHNNIHDVSPLEGLTALTELWLEGNPIKDTGPLYALLRQNPDLKIYLESNKPLTLPEDKPAVPPKDASIPDANLRAAIEAVLGKDGIISHLTHLNAEKANIIDLTGLEHAIYLKELRLGKNMVSNLSPLTGLTDLVGLYLGNNAVSNISPLAGLTNLESLYLGDNGISDLSPLTKLTKLRRLALNNNSISDLSPLVGLTNLRWMRLASNNISDLSPLVANTGLGNEDEVDVRGNPLNYASIYTHIPELQSRGVTVEFDTRKVQRLLKISGDNQQGTVGAMLTEPFVVEVRDRNGAVFAGVPVTFAVTVGGGTLSVTSTTTDENGRVQSTLMLGTNRGTNNVAVSAAGTKVQVIFNAISNPLTTEYLWSIPAGISLIHVPLKVTAVDGVDQPIESISDLYTALGGVTAVNFLMTYDPQVQEWRSYFGVSDRGTPADRALTDDTGIIAGMKTPVSIRLSGTALGTNGNSTITLNQGLNLVGIPLRDERINRVSDLLRLDGIGGNVPVVTLSDGGEFKVVGRASDPGDIAITGGGAFILNARQTATVAISGEAWTNVSETAAAPLVTPKSIEVGDATPVLGLRGSVVDEEAGLDTLGFRVTVKNLSTGRTVAGMTKDEGTGYQLTAVDIETARAATIGDILEISAQSPNPFIGVQSLRYTVTAEDVRQSRIQLPALVAYEIPAETELLANYPNPFNPETWIPYRLAEDAFVTLIIYDGSGRVVRTLDIGHRIASTYENRSKAIYWDGRDEVGESVASGVYFYHLSAGDYSATRKMLILK